MSIAHITLMLYIHEWFMVPLESISGTVDFVYERKQHVIITKPFI
jgi:hypothetical protein